MAALVDRALTHLSALVACDTQNPPRRTTDSGIVEYLRENLPGFRIKFEDLGDGCQNILAVRGNPRILYNFHVDTVPASESWSSDPFELVVEEGRAIGLGACDIKGASACMLAAAEVTDGDLALLFSTDEEAGSSRCVRTFVESEEFERFEAVIVAEPTEAGAVVEHRGIATCTGEFRGVAGHASKRRALTDSAVHRASRWAAAALSAAEEFENRTYRSLSGIRFNLGVFDGGIKPNIIAPDATVRFGCRPLPDQHGPDLLAELQALADADHVEWTPGFYGPTLPAIGDASKARQLAEELGLEIGEAVDFWTEASLFSEAGVPAIVFGPGDIAQAHTADEWVAVEQLEAVARKYTEMIT